MICKAIIRQSIVKAKDLSTSEEGGMTVKIRVGRGHGHGHGLGLGREKKTKTKVKKITGLPKDLFKPVRVSSFITVLLMIENES